MRRNHAFWGALCIAVGVTLLMQDELRQFERLIPIARIVLSVGILSFGVALVIAQHSINWIAAFASGICIGFFIGAAIAEPRVAFGSHLYIGCNANGEYGEAEDTKIPTDTTVSDKKQPLADTAHSPYSKPVY
ncbi:MAG: hypothetical protein N2663_05885 [Chlorobi bacterium]|nr:hypothetical protein [Chlorobiota bacterium]